METVIDGRTIYTVDDDTIYRNVTIYKFSDIPTTYRDNVISTLNIVDAVLDGTMFEYIMNNSFKEVINLVRIISVADNLPTNELFNYVKYAWCNNKINIYPMVIVTKVHDDLPREFIFTLGEKEVVYMACNKCVWYNIYECIGEICRDKVSKYLTYGNSKSARN